MFNLEREFPAPLIFLIMLIASIILSILGLLTTIGMTASNRNFTEYLNEKNNMFSSDEAETARIFNSEPEKFNRMTSELGIHPNLAASSILGSAGSSTPFAAQASPVGQFLNDPALSNLFGSMSDKLYDSAKQQAEIASLNADTRFTDMQTLYKPLEFDEIKRVNDELIAKYQSEGRYHESFADYYDELTLTVQPLAASECAERLANYNKLMSEAELIGEKINTEIVQQDLYSAEASLAYQKIKESKAYEALLGEQKLTQNQITIKMTHEARSALYQSVLDGMDVNIRNAFDQAPLPQSAKEYLVLASAFGDDEAKKAATDLVDFDIFLSRRVYDAETQAMYDNWWKLFALNATNMPTGVATGVGMMIGGRTGRSVGSKATPVNRKAGKGSPKGGSNGYETNRHYNVDGHDVRVDSHGTKWIDGVPQ